MRTCLTLARVTAAMLTVAVLLPAPARAEPGSGPMTWSVAPSGPKGPNGRPALDYKLDPGATVTDHVAVTNHSKQPLTLHLYPHDAFTTATGGFDLRAGNADAADADAGKWIKLSQERITLPASSRVVVPFTLTVPGNATPGDHAAGVVASLVTDTTDATGNRVSVDHRVGSRVYLRVTGPLQPALTVTDVTVTATTSWNPLKLPRVTAALTVANTGNVRLSGTPEARIEGLFGWGARTASATAIPQILPGGSVRTTVELDAVPPLFRENLLLDILPAPADGRAIDPAPVRVISRHDLWLVPWHQLALLALACALVLGWFLIRRRRKRRMRQALAAAEQRGREQAGKTPAGTSGSTTEKENS